MLHFMTYGVSLKSCLGDCKVSATGFVMHLIHVHVPNLKIPVKFSLQAHMF